jgi:hypothetical protein
MAHEKTMWLIGRWATGGGATTGSGTRRGMLAKLEEALNVALVWIVPRVTFIGENINSRHLTNHLEDPRSILATLVCRHGAHNNFLPNEIKYAKVFFSRCHPHKNFFGHIGDVGIVTDLRSESVAKKLVQHPIDRFHSMSGTKLHLAIHGIIHESHLTIKRKLPTMKLGATKILLTKSKNLRKSLIRDGEGLALKEPIEGPCFTTDIEIGIELSDHFFIPIIVDCHHVGHPLGMTNINSIIDRRDVE